MGGGSALGDSGKKRVHEGYCRGRRIKGSEGSRGRGRGGSRGEAETREEVREEEGRGREEQRRRYCGWRREGEMWRQDTGRIVRSGSFPRGFRGTSWREVQRELGMPKAEGGGRRELSHHKLTGRKV